MKFTGYQTFVVAVLAFLQFTIVLDFMILSPLGALLLQELHITTAQFGLVVSAYAFSAGLSGILAAGFADKFDRKKLLMFFYSGFIVGTLLCGVASDYHMLLVARVVTGLFGGVIGSISFAIIADLFPFEMRGRVMGFVQTAFAASQVMGIPVGLYLSNHWGWHSPFLMIVAAALLVWFVLLFRLQPIDAHLKVPSEQNPIKHIVATVSQPRYLWAFLTTMLLSTGGFMLMPFGSTFSVHNLGISLGRLPLVYMVTGISAMVVGPLLGRLSDAIGKYRVFLAGSLVCTVIIVIYCTRGITPIEVVILLNVLLFACIMARVISSQSLLSAVPAMKDRGAFMAINAAIQQLSGGVAASIAGLIVVQTPGGQLDRYDVLGYVVCAAVLCTIGLMYKVNAQLAAAGTETAPRPAPAR
ncbi:MFS transporter [Pendulispora albinea]|uniref:MFS transporter n=1 Tax=Pendulispora albinea TaxID=2741071 RepID=A0ABZ2M4X7_9BACT